MQTMAIIRGAGRQGLHPEDDRRRAKLQGAAAGAGAMPGGRKETVKGSLVTHRQTQHGVAKGGLGKEGNKEDRGNDTRIYMMELPAKAGPRPCSVKGSSGWASMQTEMRVHFCHRYIKDTVAILEKGNLSHPQ